MAKRNDLNPSEKSKISLKYKHNFLTSEQFLHSYYEHVNTFMV